MAAPVAGTLLPPVVCDSASEIRAELIRRLILRYLIYQILDNLSPTPAV